ncbi:MAG: GGDEF domain-containing protein [Campylobacterales bacterium]|nr:GGDEF domain-containing protein [Campylobacterales bacterium]
MENKLIDLVKSVLLDPQKLPILENICELCEKFRFSYTIDEMTANLQTWLKEKYQIESMTFSLFNMDKNINCVLLNVGENYFLDGENSFYFIIDTKTELKATISFCAKNKEHYDFINSHKQYLDTLFFQISPILENALLKKLYLDNSSIDSVTNVYNRKYLLEYIHKKISLSNETEDNITFLMIGIDRFKAVIDEFDYDAGDVVLMELAKVIHSNIKNHDIVARLTGDEFLVALLHLRNPSDSIAVAQKIIEKFAQTSIVVNEDTGQILKKTICVGIATYPKDGSTIEDAIKNADKFLEEAKNKGRSQFAVYTKDDESAISLF